MHRIKNNITKLETKKDNRFVKIENNKSIIQMNERLTGKTEVDIAVYTAIKSFLNYKTKECFPSLDTIQEMLGISEPTLIKSIRNLALLGDFQKIKKGRKSYYVFPEETDNWKPIDLEFVKISPTELTVLEKGFIIMLRKYLKDNTNVIHINAANLAKTIGVSYETVSKRIRKLQGKGYLFYEKGDDDVYNYISSYKIKFNMEKLQLRLDKIEQDISQIKEDLEESKVKVYNIEDKLSKIEEESATYMTKDEFKKEMDNYLKQLKNGK